MTTIVVTLVFWGWVRRMVCGYRSYGLDLVSTRSIAEPLTALTTLLRCRPELVVGPFSLRAWSIYYVI